MFSDLLIQGNSPLWEKYKVWLVYLISFLYICLNACLIYRDIYWSLLLPVLLVLLYFYFYRLDVILLLTTCLTPLAINVVQYELGAGISLPTEPLLFGVLLLFMLKLFFRNDVDREVWKHPISIIILLQLFWMLITSLTSQIPIVSFKFLITRLWFVVPFFFLGTHLFKKIIHVRLFIWLYAVPLIGVIIYTVYQHYLWGFQEEPGHWVMYPFYNDHTAYGAILALFIPVFTGFMFSRIYKPSTRFFSAIILIVFVVALILSYCRAAWISTLIAFAAYLIILFRIKFKWLALSGILLVIFFMLFQNEIWDVLERNKQGTSGNFVEHVQSISNISTDDSNLERINRWQSAIRMFQDRPVFGFGPGTYQFEYAPYQLSQEKTTISTNAGDRGNAHSEYIGPLAEEGIPGMLLMVILVIYVLIVGIRVYHQAKTPEIKIIGLTVLLGLVTYFSHGVLNNFLDTDKASVPVWGFIAILVAFDIYNQKKEGTS